MGIETLKITFITAGSSVIILALDYEAKGSVAQIRNA